MKKFVPVLLGLTLAASLTACATKTVKEAPSAAPQTTAAAMEETTEAPAETSGAETEAAAKTEDTVTAAATDYFKNFPEDKHMASVADLFAKIDAGEDMVIIDIRKPDDYAAGHLKGAWNIPYGAAVAESLDKIPDDTPVYVNCYTGQTSSQTVALLNAAGKLTP